MLRQKTEKQKTPETNDEAYAKQTRRKVKQEAQTQTQAKGKPGVSSDTSL
jgi:hypothetical protein